jgi:hypothetical protein
MKGDDLVEWKEWAGKRYSQREEDYIHTFNSDGGGAYRISKYGMYHISYIARESKFIIFIANIKLWAMWLRLKLQHS